MQLFTTTSTGREKIMGRLKYVFVGILALMLSGCGQTVVETLNVPSGPGINGPGAGKTVVILPFADYSNANNLAAAFRRNLSVIETLTDRLVSNGFGLPIQEDVFRYLVEQKIISISAYDNMASSSLSNELDNEWSPAMKNQLKKYLEEVRQEKASKITASPGTHGLRREAVAKIGRMFNADYVVRGRILEFKTRQEGTWAPWKRGILPFFSGTTSQMLFGFASSDYYDMTNQMVAGAALGAFGGSTFDNPYDSGQAIKIFGDNIRANTILWGSIGALAGEQASHSGKIDQAVVQLRIWIQEAATGNVVWTNRVDVKVSPQSILADGQYDMLFDKAINKGISTLVNDFVTYGL